MAGFIFPISLKICVIGKNVLFAPLHNIPRNTLGKEKKSDSNLKTLTTKAIRLFVSIPVP
jgi:hypothetical protein